MRTTSGLVSCVSRTAASPSSALAHHLEVVEGAEPRGQAPAHDRMVVGEQHADRHRGDH
jgi:hypothetical protein